MPVAVSDLYFQIGNSRVGVGLDLGKVGVGVG